MPRPRVHRPTALVQAVDVQPILHRALLQLGIDFGNAQNTAERQRIAASLAKTTEAWRTATTERREILGKPRVGSLSPAERAELRRRKQKRPNTSGPFVMRSAPPQTNAPVTAPPPLQTSSG